MAPMAMVIIESKSNIITLICIVKEKDLNK